MKTAFFQAKFENLDSIREYVGLGAKDAGFNDSDIYAVQLAADEACSNIIEHAYGNDDTGLLECSYSFDGEYLVLTFKDYGCFFDPTSVSDPDLTSSLEQRQIGGLGLFLIKNLMDDVQYESHGEAGNVLTLKKRLRV
ncbi:MAG TPA: ATP-binding protein [Anaerolineales bacterium]|nr:ATP-binding protein [Anaerolineales bacterium]